MSLATSTATRMPWMGRSGVMRARRSSIVEGFGGEVFHAFAGLRGWFGGGGDRDASEARDVPRTGARRRSWQLPAAWFLRRRKGARPNRRIGELAERRLGEDKESGGTVSGRIIRAEKGRRERADIIASHGSPPCHIQSRIHSTSPAVYSLFTNLLSRQSYIP